MSDSDETICDNTEYDNRVPESDTQDSPSIFSAAVPIANSSDKENNGGDDEILQQTGTLLSPECLPPSAKLKRTETANTSSTNDIAMASTDTNAPKGSCVSTNQIREVTFPPEHPLDVTVQRAKEPYGIGRAFDISVSSTDGEEASKLENIKKQEHCAEELLIVLEKQGSAGSDLTKCPNFLQAKGLLASIHLQLSEFCQSQQQMRSELLKHQLTQIETSQAECLRAVWNKEDKQRLQALASRQRELLKLFKKHKELVGRLQSLKHADRRSKGCLLPCMEKHFKFTGETGLPETTGASTKGLSTAVLSPRYSCGIPEPGIVHTQKDNVRTSTSVTSALQAASQHVYTPVIQEQSVQNVPSSTGVPVGSISVQPALQQILLTGGQLYQVGGQQVYVIPNTAISTPVCAVAASMTQANSTSTTAANTTPVVMVHSQMDVTSIQGSGTTMGLPSLSVPTVPMMPIARQPSLIAESSLTMTSGSAKEPSSNLWSSLPRGQQATSSGTQSSSNVNTQHSVPSPSLHPADRLAYEHTSSKQRSAPAMKSVVTASGSTRATTLVRRHSFQSDLPDLKCLLDHGVIDAGPNLLSVQFEGKRYEASLMPSGSIKSTEGESFHTPMAWLKVSYKGKPLAAYAITQAARGSSSIQANRANTITSPGFTENQFSQEKIPGVSQQQCLRAGIHAPPAQQDPSQQKIIRNQLMSCHNDLSRFLRNCHVMPIADQELVPSNTFLPLDFWVSKSEVKLPLSLIKELDF